MPCDDATGRASRELDPELYQAITQNKLPGAVDMNRAFTHANDANDVTTAYYAASQMLVFLVERHGMPKISSTPSSSSERTTASAPVSRTGRTRAGLEPDAGSDPVLAGDCCAPLVGACPADGWGARVAGALTGCPRSRRPPRRR